MNQQNNIVVLWFKENLQRLFTESPTFFKIWSWISGILFLITGIPELINSMIPALSFPEIWSQYINSAITFASGAALLMSKLTTQSTPIAQTLDGTLLKHTNIDALPFTAQKEDKLAKDIPVVVKHLSTRKSK